jgi:ADP-heptose:LPS heptosyltransferase
VLVLRALGLGDLLTAVPALRAVRDAFPRAELVVACPAWLHELVELWGLADVAVPVDALEPLPRKLRGANVAVNLHGRGPESNRLLLETDPGRLIAFASRDMPETAGMPEWHQGEHEVERWCRLLRESEIEADPRRLDLPPPLMTSGLVDCVVLHPGAASPARRWPPLRWAQVAYALTERGELVVLTGSEAERDLCVEIATLAQLGERCAVHAGRPLLELAGIVGAARLVVCGDTGVAHLATALRVPSVILFGPTPPAEWGPPPDRRRVHRALWAGTRGDAHGDEPDPGLLALTTSSALREIDDVLRVATTPRVAARA